MPTPVAFQSLPPDAFPMLIRAYPQSSTEDTDLLWEHLVEGPGMCSIPGLQETGQPVRIHIIFGDGTEARA